MKQWRIGLWIAFGLLCLVAMFAWNNPIPMILPIALSGVAARWIHS